MKRILCLFLLTVLLCGCASPGDLQAGPGEPDVVLTYYSIGRDDPDLPLVGEALNRLMIERYGFGVDYRRMDFNEYGDGTSALINTGSSFDVMFTWGSHYAKHAGNGVFLSLDSCLSGENKRLYEAVDSRLWQGVKVNDTIYGVPTNKELGPVVQLLFSRDLIEKYQINPYGYQTIESLEPLLSLIKEQEPEVVPLLFTSERLNLTEYLGYEYVAGEDLPFVVRQDDPECRVVNLYDTQEMQDLQQTLRRYYQKGYINSDATVRTSISRFSGEQVFCRIAAGGPDAGQSFSLDFGYPILSVETGTPRVTNQSARGGIMAVSARTAHPREAMQFLTAVNLDPDVRNLLNYGIEGTHYTLTDQDQVHMISDAYRGVPYTQGNWYILKTTEGEKPDKWDRYRTYNENAESSRLLGFEPDLSHMESNCAGVSRAYTRFDNALLTGSVAPKYYRNIALNHMYQAGADSLRQELQQQIDSWMGFDQETERKEESQCQN